MKFIDTDGIERHKGWIYRYTCVGESLKWFGWDYVGQTRQRGGVNRRDRSHKVQKHGKSMFDSVYQAHPNAFQLDVVDEYVCDTEQELVDTLNEMETYYIRLFCSFVDWGNGFNRTTGGGQCMYSDEARKMMSLSAIGRVSWNKGKTYHYSEERKKEIYASRIGFTPWNKGKKFTLTDEEKSKRYTQEVIEKIRKANIGKRHTTETKYKMSSEVWIYDIKESFRFTFRSYNDAEQFLCLCHNKLYRYFKRPYRGRWLAVKPGESIDDSMNASMEYVNMCNEKRRRKHSDANKNRFDTQEKRDEWGKKMIGFGCQSCKVRNIEDGTEIEFNSRKDACEYMGCRREHISKYQEKPYKCKFLFVPINSYKKRKAT